MATAIYVIFNFFVYFIIAIIVLVEIIYLNWKANKHIKQKEAARRERERQAQQEKEAERKRKEAERRIKEQEQAQMLNGIQTAFSGYPWSFWPAATHDGKYQLRRIERACTSKRLSLLSFCPVDYSARIRGDSLAVYKVTPMKCECPDFQKRMLPCKHMYYFALKLFDGFDDDTYIGVDCPILSNQEQIARQNRNKIENSASGKEIIDFLRKNGPLPMRSITSHFSWIDKKDIKNTMSRLRSVGSITAEQLSSGRYLYSISEEDKPSKPDFFQIELPVFPPYPQSPSSLRGYTNMGTFEVHGTNKLTGKQNKITVYALDERDAIRFTRLFKNLAPPFSAREIKSCPVSDRQYKFILDLKCPVKEGDEDILTSDEDILTSIDAAALIEKGLRCNDKKEVRRSDYTFVYSEEEINLLLNQHLSKEQWNDACLARVYASMCFDKIDYDNAMANRYWRTYPTLYQ